MLIDQQLPVGMLNARVARQVQFEHLVTGQFCQVLQGVIRTVVSTDQQIVQVQQNATPSALTELTDKLRFRQLRLCQA